MARPASQPRRSPASACRPRAGRARRGGCSNVAVPSWRLRSSVSRSSSSTCARITASGVRSSCEASETKSRCRLNARSEPLEHVVKRLRQHAAPHRARTPSPGAMREIASFHSRGDRCHPPHRRGDQRREPDPDQRPPAPTRARRRPRTCGADSTVACSTGGQRVRRAAASRPSPVRDDRLRSAPACCRPRRPRRSQSPSGASSRPAAFRRVCTRCSSGPTTSGWLVTVRPPMACTAMISDSAWYGCVAMNRRAAAPAPRAWKIGARGRTAATLRPGSSAASRSGCAAARRCRCTAPGSSRRPPPP